MAWRDLPLIFSVAFDIMKFINDKVRVAWKVPRSKWNLIRYVSECVEFVKEKKKKTKFVCQRKWFFVQLTNCWWQIPQTFKGLRLFNNHKRLSFIPTSLKWKQLRSQEKNIVHPRDLTIEIYMNILNEKIKGYGFRRKNEKVFLFWIFTKSV